MSIKNNFKYIRENLSLRTIIIFIRNFFLTILLLSPLLIYLGGSSLYEISLSNENHPFTIWNGKDPKTEIIITWETSQSESSAVWLGKESNLLSLVYNGDGAGVKVHRVELNSLELGTKYYYRVGVNSEPLLFHGPLSSFTTAPDDENKEFKFALYSDSQQLFGIGSHDRIVKALEGYNDLAFVGNIGDLCQEWDHQGDWNLFLLESRSFMSQTIFVPVLGNHDGWYGESEGHENKYKKYFGIATDSNIADENHTLFNYTFSYSNTQFIVAEISKEEDEDPTKIRNVNHDIWLNSTLANCQDKTFRILMFHRQVFSSNGMNTRLIDRIVPIVEKYNISMVIYGHTHHYERFLYNGVTYLLLASGGVMPTDTGINPATPYTKSFNMGTSYTFFSVSTNNLTVKTITPDNDIIDSFVLKAENSKAVLLAGGVG